MSNEFKHISVGGNLSQSEWEALGGHIADGQVAGDILYFDGTYWKRRPYDIGARAYHNANQNVAHNTETALALNSERWDTDTIHDNVTNNSRLTCKTAGKYLISGMITWEPNATGERTLNIKLNNTTKIAIVSVVGSTVVNRQNITTVYNLAVNDYVELTALQNSGGTLIVYSVGNYSPEFMMQRIG